MDWPTAHVSLDTTWTPIGAVAALLVVLVIGWVTEKRHAAKRRTIRRLYSVGEQLLTGRSSSEGLRLLESMLPELLGVDDVRVYLVDRNTGSLAHLVSTAADSAASPALAEERVRFRLRNAELCFRNRSLLAVPDARRSPMFEEAQALETPHSMLFIPMSALDDPLGVLTVGDTRRVRMFHEDERGVLQHLGNQIAIGMRLREQKSLRAHTTGAERLDALQQLVTAAAGEIERPLLKIAEAARRPGDGTGAPADPVARQAALALRSLERLRRFAGLHREEEGQVDAAAAVRALVHDLREEWRARGFELSDATGDDPLPVAAPAGALEQVFYSLLQHAETRLPDLRGKQSTVRTLRLAATAQIDLTWPAPEADAPEGDPLGSEESPAEDVLSLSVCRSLVAGMGGHMRIARDSEGGSRLEMELPLSQRGLLDPSELPRSKGRPLTLLTALVLEPDRAARHSLIAALGDLGHRGVPASTAEEAVDLANRVPFHVFFCSARSPGGPWQDCYQDTRKRIRTFVLLTQGHDPALDAALSASDALTLALPLHRQDLERLLETVESRTASPGR